MALVERSLFRIGVTSTFNNLQALRETAKYLQRHGRRDNCGLRVRTRNRRTSGVYVIHAIANKGFLQASCPKTNHDPLFSRPVRLRIGRAEPLFGVPSEIRSAREKSETV